MTEHTPARRIPKLYKEAGKILQKVKEQRGSVKTLVYGARHPNLKALYALVVETIKHGKQLDYLVRKTNILLENPKLNPWVTRVLMTELLWQKKALSPVSPPQEIVQSYHEKFLSELANIPGGETKEDTPKSSATAQPTVRYVRVNTLKSTTEDVVTWFKNDGWNEITVRGNTEKDYLKKLQELTGRRFIRDCDIPDLLVFPYNFKFYETDLYKQGTIILQDKASCAPPCLLNPPSGSIILDMCASPGMKTTQLAALIGNKGTIYAVENHEQRYDTLCKTVEKYGATCVKTIKGDVLKQSDLQDVEYIILDPPCSGSGMLNRKAIFGDEGPEPPKRLNNLAYFQGKLLDFAMTNFPKAKRIVYSTCSVNPEENEAVIESVFKKVPPNFAPVKDPEHAGWMTRGSSTYENGECGFYAGPDTHLTNGFFVAVFERTDLEYVSPEPSTKTESAANLETNGTDDKKKKRPHRELGEKDNNPEKKVNKKKKETDDAKQKMLSAMQKISQSSSEKADEDSDEDNSQLNGSKIKKKKLQQGEKVIKGAKKRIKRSIPTNGARERPLKNKKKSLKKF